MYKRKHIGLDLIDIRCRETHSKFFQERLFGYVLLIELKDTLVKMCEVKWYIMTDIPFKVIPISPLDAVFPRAIDQSVHFAGKQVCKCKASSHKGLRKQQILFSVEFQWRLCVNLFFCYRN